MHDGSALVADFGIALAVQSAGGQRMTQTGLSLGTPQYMSPEQAMGERTIDARSDIYALGAVMYEMLVGEAPFTGPSVQAIVARILTEEPRSIAVQRKAAQLEGTATTRPRGSPSAPLPHSSLLRPLQRRLPERRAARVLIQRQNVSRLLRDQIRSTSGPTRPAAGGSAAAACAVCSAREEA